jgi:hypothetical protein
MHGNFVVTFFVFATSATAGIILLTSSGLFGFYTFETVRRIRRLRAKPASSDPA